MNTDPSIPKLHETITTLSMMSLSWEEKEKGRESSRKSSVEGMGRRRVEGEEGEGGE